MQADPDKAWQSARRWKQTPVVLVINAKKMEADGFRFGVSDNGVVSNKAKIEFRND